MYHAFRFVRSCEQPVTWQVAVHTPQGAGICASSGSGDALEPGWGWGRWLALPRAPPAPPVASTGLSPCTTVHILVHYTTCRPHVQKKAQLGKSKQTTPSASGAPQRGQMLNGHSCAGIIAISEAAGACYLAVVSFPAPPGSAACSSLLGRSACSPGCASCRAPRHACTQLQAAWQHPHQHNQARQQAAG